MGGPARSEDAVPFLQSPLAEEEATDKKLMQLAQSRQAGRKGRPRAAFALEWNGWFQRYLVGLEPTTLVNRCGRRRVHLRRTDPNVCSDEGGRDGVNRQVSVVIKVDRRVAQDLGCMIFRWLCIETVPSLDSFRHQSEASILFCHEHLQ